MNRAADMFRNYSITAVRGLSRNRLDSFIKIFGLAAGLAAAMLIALFVRDELSFDQSWQDADRLHRLNTTWLFPGRTPQHSAITSGPASQALLDYFPVEIESSARINNKEPTLTLGDRVYVEKVSWVDPSILNIFDFEILSGNTRTTLADICSSLRGFLRFLHATERLAVDLAPSVMAPIVRRGERPLRALPWDDVRRILSSIDRSTTGGRRDYALLLLMSVYGMGAGEVIRLSLDDINWRGAILHVTRPKTGVKIQLPLLPAVARVLVTYLRHGRPQHAGTRHLFVSLQSPHGPLTSSSAVRHIIHQHARSAGVSASYLGAHVLRHTHACRELEQGVPPKLIGDILGHRRPESTSAYLRVATGRLREVALPLPS